MNNSTVLILTTLISFVISASLGIVLIPFLHKIHFGQTILDIGPAWHKKKQGTPIMGGFMFIISIPIAVITGYMLLRSYQPQLLSAPGGIKLFDSWIMAMGFGAIGFMDDYIKVVKKQNLGLTARQKYMMQLVIAAIYLVMLYMAGDRSTSVAIPFFGRIELGPLYYVFALILITGFVNAVNLTDGVDGLSSSVTFVNALAMLVVTGILGFTEAGLASAALAGGLLGYLIWNFYPAKVFMGDTGSLFMGGMVVGLAFQVGLPLLLVLTGVIYWCEALSVILQVISFKTTGKRIFKMSPIHHHFELSGWSEVRIVGTFAAVGLIGGAFGVWSVLLL